MDIEDAYEEINKNFNEWLEKRDLGKDAELITEAMQTSRYSIEVNYRTKIQEAMDSYAKITLGYVSAGMKNVGYHCKVVFNDKPYRILVSTRNWDDGEWIGITTYNHDKNCFIIAKGSYNKDRKTVSLASSKKCNGDSAAEIVKELKNLMEELKREKPRGSDTLEPAQLKRGPKPTHLKKINKVSGPWKPKKAI